jgi:poly-gamma-glutamate synthesis protein (capsule biosynthesis protein)
VERRRSGHFRHPAAKAAGADLIIPFMHWGWENEPTPTRRLQTFARR